MQVDLEVLNFKADVLECELQNSIELFGITKEELVTRAQNLDIVTKSYFAVHGSGIMILTGTARTILQNLKERNYNEDIVLQNVSLAIIGSRAFKIQLDNFIKLLNEDILTLDIDLVSLKEISEKLNNIVPNIS